MTILTQSSNNVDQFDLYAIQEPLTVNIPDELAQQNNWLNWKYTDIESGKPRKCPVNAQGLLRGYNDTSIHTNLKTARDRFKTKCYGSGISLHENGLQVGLGGQVGYLWCIDFDGFAKYNEPIVDDDGFELMNLLSSYTEISPSRTGFKTFLVSDKQPTTKSKIEFSPSEYLDKYPSISKYEHRAIEIFSKGSFLTITGDAVGGKDLRFVTTVDLDSIITIINSKAVAGGGKGLGSVGSVASVSGAGVIGNASYSKLLPASLEFVLRYIDNVDEQAWSDTANALARAYGEDGREFFIDYSSGEATGEVYEGFDLGVVNARFDRALREVARKPDGFGTKHLIEVAQANHAYPRDTSLQYEDALANAFAKGTYSGNSDYARNELFGNEGARNDSQREGPQPAGKLTSIQDLTMLEQVDNTDAGNVAIFWKLTTGDVRYVLERKQWIVWVDNCWQLDAGCAIVHQKMLLVSNYHKQKADKFYKDAEVTGSPEQRKMIQRAAGMSVKWSIQCRNKARLDAMLGVAQRDMRFIINAIKLDSDPRILGVANGSVDLRTGNLRANSRDDFVLKRSPIRFDPNAHAPRWIKFIDEITSSAYRVTNDKPEFTLRPHLASYLQKVLGYCMTGLVHEHVLFMAVGRGANGKNVLLDTFKAVSGDYCETITPEVLMATRSEANADQASPSTRKLAGARCAISSESKDGQKLDVAVVKRHTGGGFVSARALHENEMTFEITHKLVLMTNHIPQLDHMDDATKGRLHIIPFDIKWNRPSETRLDPKLPNADKNLMDTLKTEYEGILSWLIHGAVKYASEGLTPPNEVVASTQAYIESQDLLSRWLNEMCTACAPDQGLTAAELLNRHKSYCQSEGELPKIDSPAALSKRLTALGYASVRKNSGRRFALRVNNDDLENSQAKSVHDMLDNWDAGG